MGETQPLPGGRREPVAVWRIGMGYLEDGRPHRSDYFQIQRKVKVGSRWSWVLDKDAQALMCVAAEAAGDKHPEKPTRIPVIFPHQGWYVEGEWHPASEGIYRAMSFYSAAYRICSCSRFVTKPEEACREQALPWPPANRDIYDRPMQREYYWSPGMNAVRVYYRKDTEGNLEIVKRENLRCDPATCEFCQSATAEGLAALLGNVPKSMLGAELCKPQVICPLILPWLKGGDPRAKLTSSGKNTAFVLPASLDDVENMCGRAPIPLLTDEEGGPGLLLVMKQVNLQTPTGRYNLPIAEFEAKADFLKLPQIGKGIVQMLTESQDQHRLLGQYHESGTGIVRWELEDESNRAAFAAEFRASDVPDFGNETMADRYDRLAAELGWSDAQTKATWESLRDGPDNPQGLPLEAKVAEMEQLLTDQQNSGLIPEGNIARLPQEDAQGALL